MRTKPLFRVLFFALAVATLAGAIALKQRANSRALMNAEPNASITSSVIGEGERCTGATGQAANEPACMKPRRKNQERFIGAGDSASNDGADFLPADPSVDRSSSPPKGTAEPASGAGKAPRLIPLRSTGDDGK